MEKIRSNFSPLCILQQDEQKKFTLGQPQPSAEFDAIWQFEILSLRKFEHIENPLKVGVFESQKCYFVVFFKDQKASIMMWRGKDQTLLS